MRIFGILALLGGLISYVGGVVFAVSTMGEGNYPSVFVIGHVLVMIGVATLILSFLPLAKTTVEAAVHCPECGQSYAGQTSLNWHLQRAHSREPLRPAWPSASPQALQRTQS